MRMEGAFPAQGMPDLVVNLGSIGMTRAGAGDGELNTALPSWEWEASMAGKKSPFWGAASFGEAKPAASGAERGLGMEQWGRQAGNPPRSSLRLVVLRPSSVLHHSAGPSAAAAPTGSHPLSGELGGHVGRRAPAVGLVQGSPSRDEMQTSPLIRPDPPRDRWRGIPGTAPPSRQQAIAEHLS